MSTTPPQRGEARIVPVLPLRDIVVFPHMIVPLFVGRVKSVRALEEAIAHDKEILLVTQREPGEDDPGAADIHGMGVLGKILQILKLPDGAVKLLVEGNDRAEVSGLTTEESFLQANIQIVTETEPKTSETLQASVRAVAGRFEEYAKLSKKIPNDVFSSVVQIEEPGRLTDTVAAQIGGRIEDRQKLLETVNITKRIEALLVLIGAEIGVMRVERKIRSRVKTQMEKTQRDYYLNEQLKAIQRELGDGGENKDEGEEFEERLAKVKLSKEAQEKAVAELKKLRSMSPMSAESTVVRGYLDWLLGVPWKKRTRINRDLRKAEKILNEDHYGLEKVKERILEYLAVQQRTRSARGQILCLVGPPGVGKTSLGESVARATGRKFVRISLGGVRDESEIRGHRRTYIGSMPGRIVQGMKKAGVSNPLFLLDEVDKIGADWRGDPASALLEVLDPEQNKTFNDHYLEVDYDLSDVFFLTTANTRSMPQALLDRMEIIPIPGYTENEKVEIATRHLIRKQMKRNGLDKTEWGLSATGLRNLIRHHTREAGVRSLEREIARLCRKAARLIVMGETKKVSVTGRNLSDFLGANRFRFGEVENERMTGVVTGLAYTETGGDLLSIEAVTMPGKGRRQITGQLGDVMKESVKAAVSYIRSRAPSLGIDPQVFETRDIHVHVPEGATPKDGPSAGVAIATAILSALTGVTASARVAMTGEITLRGRVLPIGGLKEKLLAALRGNIQTVLIPRDNEKDLEEIPAEVRKKVKIIPVTEVDDVLPHVLPDLQKTDWTLPPGSLDIPAGPPLKPAGGEDTVRH